MNLDEANLTAGTQQPSPGRLHGIARFALAGAFLGIAVGLWEAGMIYFRPSDPRLAQVDATYVVWFIAVLVDLLLFALAGAALGAVSALGRIRKREHIAILDAILVALAGLFATRVPLFLHDHPAGFEPFKGIHILSLFAALRYGLGFFLGAILAFLAWRRFAGSVNFRRFRPLRSATVALAAVIAVLGSGILYYASRPRFASGQTFAHPPGV